MRITVFCRDRVRGRLLGWRLIVSDKARHTGILTIISAGLFPPRGHSAISESGSVVDEAKSSRPHTDAAAHRLAWGEHEKQGGILCIDDDPTGWVLGVVVDQRATELRRQCLLRVGLGLYLRRETPPCSAGSAFIGALPGFVLARSGSDGRVASVWAGAQGRVGSEPWGA